MLETFETADSWSDRVWPAAALAIVRDAIAADRGLAADGCQLPRLLPMLAEMRPRMEALSPPDRDACRMLLVRAFAWAAVHVGGACNEAPTRARCPFCCGVFTLPEVPR